jgi:hypothetical protein
MPGAGIPDQRPLCPARPAPGAPLRSSQPLPHPTLCNHSLGVRVTAVPVSRVTRGSGTPFSRVLVARKQTWSLGRKPVLPGSDGGHEVRFC